MSRPVPPPRTLLQHVASRSQQQYNLSALAQPSSRASERMCSPICASIHLPLANLLHTPECSCLHACLPICLPACLQLVAQVLLLRAGLADPLNQRFVMLSESCVPLYPPATVYWQLLSERRSRINTCTDWFIEDYM